MFYYLANDRDSGVSYYQYQHWCNDGEAGTGVNFKYWQNYNDDFISNTSATSCVVKFRAVDRAGNFGAEVTVNKYVVYDE